MGNFLPEKMASMSDGVLSMTNRGSCGHNDSSGYCEEGSTKFFQSISNDIMAINSLVQELDRDRVCEFVDFIENCEGQILLSGIGKYRGGHQSLYAWLLAVHRSTIFFAVISERSKLVYIVERSLSTE